MATQKRIDGDYRITTLNPLDNVTVQTHTLEIIGNLDVAGNLTYINVSELNVKDPFILVNASNTGSYSSNSGLLTHETASDFAGLRYNATSNQWEVSTLTDSLGTAGTWTAIATGNAGAPGGANTDVQFNDGGTLGGTGNLTFDKVSQTLTITGHMDLGYPPGAVTAAANTTALFGNNAGSGSSGVYFNTGADTDELISATKAKLLAIIL